MKYKTGDVVRLKSGGPRMTVNKYEKAYDGPADLVACAWFAGAKHEYGVFREETLVAAEEEGDKK